MNHTKGEWKISNMDEKMIVVEKTSKGINWGSTVETVETYNQRICKMFLDGRQGRVKEWESNAKLIMAAPQLLEALQMAVNILECKNGYDKKFDNPRCIEEMKDAIEKATK